MLFFVPYGEGPKESLFYSWLNRTPISDTLLRRSVTVETKYKILQRVLHWHETMQCTNVPKNRQGGSSILMLDESIKPDVNFKPACKLSFVSEENLRERITLAGVPIFMFCWKVFVYGLFLPRDHKDKAIGICFVNWFFCNMLFLLVLIFIPFQLRIFEIFEISEFNFTYTYIMVTRLNTS